MSSEPVRQKFPLTLLIIFLLLATGIGTSGYLYYAQQKEHLRKETGNNLSSIADLKVKQIANWREERLADAEAIYNNPLIISHIQQWLNSGSSDIKQEILIWMKSLQEHYHYKSFILIDIKGNIRLAVPDVKEVLGPDAKKLTEEAAGKKKVIFSDLYRSKNTNHIHLALVVPLLVQKGQDSVPIGTLLLRIDPYQFLYPFIQTWPTPSKTAETVLFRREGNEVVFLNELRHKKDTALNLRFSISEPNLPSAIAMRGIRGVVEGIDYKGVPVLATVKPVPDSPWYLLAKINKEEIYAPIRRDFWIVTIFVFVLIAGAGAGIGFIWKHQAAESYRKQYETEHERQIYAQRYEHLTKHANDIILLADRDGQIKDFNERAVATYGYSYDELIQMNLKDLRSSETRLLLNGQMKEVEEHNGLVFETMHQRKDGTTFPIEVSSRIIQIDGNKYYQSIGREITERKKAEESLRESEEQFRAMFEVASIGIAQADIRTGQWLRVNQKMCAITGYSAEEMLQMRVPEITHPEDRQRDWEAFQRVVRGETPDYRLEKRYIRKDGTTVWVNVNMTVIRDADGQPLRTMATIEDITERKRMEEELKHNESRMIALLELNGMIDFTLQDITSFTLEEAIRLTESKIGYLAFLNEDETVMTMYAWSKTAMEECRISDKPIIYPVETTGLWGEAVRQRRPITTNDYQAPNPWKKSYPEGHVHITRHMNIPVFDGERIVLVAGVGNKPTDYNESDVNQLTLLMEGMWRIIQRQRAETEIKQLNAELEQRVIERTVQLEAVNKELEAFSYSVSHDLRAPIRHISGFVELLMQNTAQSLDEKSGRYLNIIADSTNHMGHLIDDILSFSRMGHAEMQETLNKSDQLVKEAINQLQPEMEGRHVVWDIHPLPEIYGDPSMLKLVWINLIGNALKYTRKQTPAKIEIGYNDEKNDYIFYVKDNGAGFDMMYVHKLFNIFQRLHRAEEFEGTGVGLANVRRIIQRHGGRTWAEGKVNEGATFYFSLPKAKKNAE